MATSLISRVRPARGFTLIEVMITVAIVAILAAIAYPSYTQYVIRSRLAEVGTVLPSLRAQMEQYHQDFRRYAAVANPSSCGVNAPVVSGFVVTCTATDQTFLWVMTATSSGAAPASYSIDHQNNRRTISWPAAWGAVPQAGETQWLLRR